MHTKIWWKLMMMTGCLVLLGAVGTPARTLDKEVPASPGGLLELDLETGANVQIRGGGGSSVRVEAELAGPDGDDVELDVQEVRGGVRVRARFQGSSSRRSSRVQLDISVPSRYDVEIDSMGGAIQIRNVEGKIRGETMGGELDLEGIRGELNLRTMGGNVTLRDSDVDGKLSTMGGRVLFEDVIGDIQGSSMGGNVISRNVQRRSGSASGDEIEISTMGGNINLDEAPAGARVRTMGGEIQIRSAKEFVIAKTMGGNLILEEVDGWVKGTTMAGDIEVVMVGDPDSGRRDVTLTSYSGDVELTVPDGLDMTFDIELAYTKRSSQDYEISSDFPMQQRRTDSWDHGNGSPRKYIYGEGEVGSGKHLIRIKTINGDVRIRKVR